MEEVVYQVGFGVEMHVEPTDEVGGERRLIATPGAGTKREDGKGAEIGIAGIA